ncbi:MAG: response regulator [Bacteroidota bacterium]|jgi:two-component system chemotaxis response regulator CheY
MAKKTVLIVDDSESIREVVNFTLQNEGYDVLVAVDGEDALQYLDGRPLDIIITDLHMPNVDGLELIRKVREMDGYKHIPILFLTTESQASKKMEAKQAGATGWIIKPFVPAKLLSAISRVLR